MTSKQDRVARAIADTLCRCGVFGNKTEDDPWVIGPCYLAAKAAIAANRR